MIEDVEEFCEVCGKLARTTKTSYANERYICKCEFIRVKVIREVGHAQGESLFYARWMNFRVRPQIGEFLTIGGDYHSVHMIEHVPDAKCPLLVWLKPDHRTYTVNLGRHNIKTPPKEMVDERFAEICAEYEAAKWFRTDIWWRKK